MNWLKWRSYIFSARHPKNFHKLIQWVKGESNFFVSLLLSISCDCQTTTNNPAFLCYKWNRQLAKPVCLNEPPAHFVDWLKNLIFTLYSRVYIPSTSLSKDYIAVQMTFLNFSWYFIKNVVSVTLNGASCVGSHIDCACLNEDILLYQRSMFYQGVSPWSDIYAEQRT